MNNSTVCPKCGTRGVNGWLPCKCDHTKAITKCGICGAEYFYGDCCPNTMNEQHINFRNAMRGNGSVLRAWPPHPQANPAQQEKLDKIIALLEQIKERL